VSYNVIRFREQKSFKFLLKSFSAAGCRDLCWKVVPSNTERPLVELTWCFLGRARCCYWLTTDLDVLWWQAVATRRRSLVTDRWVPGERADTAWTVRGRGLVTSAAWWWRLWRGPLAGDHTAVSWQRWSRASTVWWRSTTDQRAEQSSPVVSAQAQPQRWRWRHDRADAEAERNKPASPCPHGYACLAYCQSRRQGYVLTPLAAERQCRRQRFSSTVTDCAMITMNRTTWVLFLWCLVAAVVTRTSQRQRCKQDAVDCSCDGGAEAHVCVSWCRSDNVISVLCVGDEQFSRTQHWALQCVFRN